MDAIDAFRRFALSVDIVNESLSKEINDILTNICQNLLGATFYGVKIIDLPDESGGINSLKTIWSNKNGTTSLIKTSDGSYKGQGSYAFDRNQKLWIINENRGKYLNEKDPCLDLWSNAKDLPLYWAYLSDIEDISYMTSIIIPLVYENGFPPVGIATFEFAEFVEFTPQSRRIFTSLSKSIASLVHSYQARNHQSTNTRNAVKEIRNLSSIKLNILQKPKIFVAFPIRHKTDVTDVIKEIEAENDDYDFIWWDKVNKSGNIDSQILENIMESRFGIVYFSEWHEQENTFSDNANVVFEAGMFHALSNKDNLKKKPVSWIPIREKYDEKIPFDFAHERIIHVKKEVRLFHQ